MKNAQGREKLEDYPDFLIEQAILGELDPMTQAEIEGLPGFAEIKAARAAEDTKILSDYKPEDMVRSIKMRALRHTPNAPKVREDNPRTSDIATAIRRIALAAVPVAAAVMVVLYVARGNPDLTGTDDMTRVKGSVSASPASVVKQGPKLEIWRKNDTRAEELQPGAQVHPKDKLQIGYQAGYSRFGMIVSIDGAGNMNLHYPEALSVSPDLNDSGTTVLPYAYELDTAPKFERFLFITSKNTFLTGEIWSSLEKQLRDDNSWAENGIPKLPEGIEALGFLLKK